MANVACDLQCIVTAAACCANLVIAFDIRSLLDMQVDASADITGCIVKQQQSLESTGGLLLLGFLAGAYWVSCLCKYYSPIAWTHAWCFVYLLSHRRQLRKLAAVQSLGLPAQDLSAATSCRGSLCHSTRATAHPTHAMLYSMHRTAYRLKQARLLLMRDLSVVALCQHADEASTAAAAGPNKEPYLAPKSPYKLSNIYILPTSITRNGTATNFTRRVSLGPRIELRWSNFPLGEASGDVQTVQTSEESIRSGLPTRFIAESKEDEITLPGYAQVG